jgi:hypothetical protein
MTQHFRSLTALAMAAAGAAIPVSAQAPQPRVPRETVSATVAGKKLEIAYGRPALKGRALADLLKQLPKDRIWRAGENEVTTLKTEADLTIGGKKVAAGTYSVYVHVPESGDWSLVLNTDPGIEVGKLLAKLMPNRPPLPPERASRLWPRLDGYTENIADTEVVRAAMKAGPTPAAAVDTFTITLAEAKDAATLAMAWADKSYSIELKAAK